MVAIRDFSGFVSSAWALARAAAMAPIDSLERCMVHLQIHQVKTDGAGFRAFGPQAVADRFLRKVAANSAQLFDAVISTMRTASNLGLGGSMPNNRGVSPFWTQRQNFF